MPNQNFPSIKIGSSQVIRFAKPLTLAAVINSMAESLVKLGYVKRSFANGLLEREKVFPTGLPTKPFGVAIPHTDAEFVYSDAIAVGILNEPVPFEEMGTFGGKSFINVSIITMLAISNPKQMVPLLSQLARCYQDEKFLKSIYYERNIENIVNLFKQRIPDIVITTD